jgi:hypothetical protein
MGGMTQTRTPARILLGLLLALSAADPAAAQAVRGPEEHAPGERFRLEHPHHRLAYWYANESMRQVRAAREMVCGFTGQRWALDWALHYRWALRAAPRRAYERIEDRDRQLATCRSRKLRDLQRPRYQRGDPETG